MRILFVLEYYHPHIGGVETLFKSLVEALDASGHQVTIITQKFRKDLPAVERMGNCTIRRYRFINRYIFTIMAFFPALYFAPKHDFIHTTSYNAGLPAFFAGFLTRRKVIITFHEFWGKLWFELPYMGRIQKRLHFWFEKFLVRLPFARFVADSESSKNALIKAGVPASKVDRIYCGLDYTQFVTQKNEEISGERFQFIYFGRLGISKGLNLLLEAAKQLVESKTAFHLHIVIPLDPKEFLQKIKEYVDHHHLSTVITFHHELPRALLHELIQSCDAVVIPSYSEGFGFVAAESVALKRPIISSHRGSLPEVVSGKHIIMNSFSAVGLKQAMLKAIRGEWKYREIIQFPLSDFAQNYIALYQKLSK